MPVTVSEEEFEIYHDMTRSAFAVLLVNGSPFRSVTEGRDETGITLVHNEEEYYIFLSGIPENEMSSLGYGRDEQVAIYTHIQRLLKSYEQITGFHFELTMYLTNRAYMIIVSPNDRCDIDRADVFQHLHEIVCTSYESQLGIQFSEAVVSVVTPSISGYGMHVQKEFSTCLDYICKRRYFLRGAGVVSTENKQLHMHDMSYAAIRVFCADIRSDIDSRDEEKLQKHLNELFLDRLKHAENMEKCSFAAAEILKLLGDSPEPVLLKSGFFIENLYEYLLSRCCSYIESIPKKSIRVSELIQAVDDYLVLNYIQDISLDDLSGYIGLNRTYLCNKYKEEMNTTIHKRVLSLRLEHARVLLDSTSDSVEKIAFASGFNNPNYFRSSFRKRLGVTPSEYRQTSRETEYSR